MGEVGVARPVRRPARLVRTPGGVRHKRMRTPQRERRLLQSVRRGGGGAVAALVGCISRWIRSFDAVVECAARAWPDAGMRSFAPNRSSRGSR